MKLLMMPLVCLAFLTLSAGAGPELLIKQKAKDLRDQNNARQGVPPTAAPTAARPVAARPPAPPQALPATTAQQALMKLQQDLAAVKPQSSSTTAQAQQFARNLLIMAQGQKKPSSTALTKLSTDILNAQGEKPLSQGSQLRLLQDLNAIVNAANLPAAQVKEVIADVQGLFSSAGLAPAKASTIATDLWAVAQGK